MTEHDAITFLRSLEDLVNQYSVCNCAMHVSKEQWATWLNKARSARKYLTAPHFDWSQNLCRDLERLAE